MLYPLSYGRNIFLFVNLRRFRYYPTFLLYYRIYYR
jgi:hypothetical protein